MVIGLLVNAFSGQGCRNAQRLQSFPSYVRTNGGVDVVDLIGQA